MKRNVLLFILVALAQLGVLAWTIFGHRRVLSEGAVYLFRTAPIDPRDPFRGEYVYLNFAAEQGPWVMQLPEDAVRGGDCFALLGTDSAGFARVTELSMEPPPTGDYFRVSPMGSHGDTVFSVSFPFNRYYLQEGDGPRTEVLMRPAFTESDTAAPSPVQAHAVVRVYGGKAQLEDLVIEGRSVQEWLNEPAPTPLSGNEP